MPILTFAKINDLLASEWLKYEPNKFYHFNSYALYINNNNAHLISKKFQVDDITHIGETVEDIRKRNTRALGAFLSIVNANGQLSL